MGFCHIMSDIYVTYYFSFISITKKDFYIITTIILTLKDHLEWFCLFFIIYEKMLHESFVQLRTSPNVSKGRFVPHVANFWGQFYFHLQISKPPHTRAHVVFTLILSFDLNHLAVLQSLTFSKAFIL